MSDLVRWEVEYTVVKKTGGQFNEKHYGVDGVKKRLESMVMHPDEPWSAKAHQIIAFYRDGERVEL